MQIVNNMNSYSDVVMSEHPVKPLSSSVNSCTTNSWNGKARRQDAGRRYYPKSSMSSVSPASLSSRYNESAHGVIGSGVGANRRISAAKNMPDYKKPEYKKPEYKKLDYKKPRSLHRTMPLTQQVPSDIVMIEESSGSSCKQQPLGHVLSATAPLLDSINLPPPSRRSPLLDLSPPPGLTHPGTPIIRPIPTIPQASWHKIGMSAPEYLHVQRQRNPHATRVMSRFNPDRAFLPKVFLCPPPKYSHNRVPSYNRAVYQWDDVEEKWQMSGKHIRSMGCMIWQSPGADDSWVPCSQRDQHCMQWRNSQCSTCQQSSSVRNRAMVAAAVINEKIRLLKEAAVTSLSREKDEESSSLHRFTFNSNNISMGLHYDNDQDMLSIVENDTSRTSLADELANATEETMVEVTQPFLLPNNNSATNTSSIGESPVPKGGNVQIVDVDCPPTPRPKLLDSFDDFDDNDL